MPKTQTGNKALTEEQVQTIAEYLEDIQDRIANTDLMPEGYEINKQQIIWLKSFCEQTDQDISAINMQKKGNQFGLKQFERLAAAIAAEQAEEEDEEVLDVAEEEIQSEESAPEQVEEIPSPQLGELILSKENLNALRKHPAAKLLLAECVECVPTEVALRGNIEILEVLASINENTGS